MTLTRDDYINQPSPIEKELRCLFDIDLSLTIFDIGSCEGEDSIKYSKLFPNSEIYAVEPLPKNVSILKKQLQKYSVSNVKILPIALSDMQGEVKLYVSSGHPDYLAKTDEWDYGNKSSSLFSPNQEEMQKYHNWLLFNEVVTVQSNTLDNVCQDEGVEKIDFIHLDVQGCELNTLKGAEKLLFGVTAIWLEVEAVPLYLEQPLKEDIELFMNKNGFVKVKDTCDHVSGDHLYVHQRKCCQYIERFLLANDAAHLLNEKKRSHEDNYLVKKVDFLTSQLNNFRQNEEKIEYLTAHLKESQQQIEAMESSKFWKIRKLWFKLKNLLKGNRGESSQVSSLSASELSPALTEPTPAVLVTESESSPLTILPENTDSNKVLSDKVNLHPISPETIIKEELSEPEEPTQETPTLLIGTLNEQTRNEWIEKVLSQIPEGLRLLDAGCGEQQYKKFCEHLVYVGQDFGEYDGQGNNRGLQTGSWDNSNLDIISDITAIPEPDQSFDAILCTEVFEHIPDPLAAIQEFSRLLRSQGTLILTAPFCSLTHFSPYHYHSGFNSYFYEFILPKYGFTITKMERNGNFFEYLAQEVRRIPFSSQTYANCELVDSDYYLIDKTLLLLDKINQTNLNSEELLCFGYHVIAVKN
jgi:FkbM family methyltransferase